MRKSIRKSRSGSYNTPRENASSKRNGGGGNGKARVLRSSDRIPSYLKLQPYKEYRIDRYAFDEIRLAKPNRRRKKRR